MVTYKHVYIPNSFFLFLNFEVVHTLFDNSNEGCKSIRLEKKKIMLGSPPCKYPEKSNPEEVPDGH